VRSESHPNRSVVLAFAVALLASAGCAGAGPYTWVQDLPPQEGGAAGAGGYAVGPGDLLNVRVFGQEDMSGRARVRRDGRIAVPFVGEVQAQGRTPAALAKEVEERLRAYVNSPKVTVAVEEFQPVTVAVLGEVVHPGTVTVDTNASVLQALANAGGMTEFASRDRIFVLRRTPTVQRIRFTYDLLSRGNLKATSFGLVGGDVVIVE
jgi:polysaccharide biosynthesis/export protein